MYSWMDILLSLSESKTLNFVPNFERLAAVCSSNVINPSPSTSAFSKICFAIFQFDEWMWSPLSQLLAIAFMLIENEKPRASKNIIFFIFDPFTNFKLYTDLCRNQIYIPIPMTPAPVPPNYCFLHGKSWKWGCLKFWSSDSWPIY